MKHLWAPWRMEYILKRKNTDCIFCNSIQERKDQENFVLVRTPLSFVMMNRFPYSYSHLMVSPIRHVKHLHEMDPSEQLDLIGLLTQSMRIIEKVCNAEGFNVGVNLGKAAGAGFEDHLHVHIVPRWDGDMNFMPILADTKVISEHLKETYDRLVVHFNDQSEENP